MRENEAESAIANSAWRFAKSRGLLQRGARKGALPLPPPPIPKTGPQRCCVSASSLEKRLREHACSRRRLTRGHFYCGQTKLNHSTLRLWDNEALRSLS